MRLDKITMVSVIWTVSKAYVIGHLFLLFYLWYIVLGVDLMLLFKQIWSKMKY